MTINLASVLITYRAISMFFEANRFLICFGRVFNPPAPRSQATLLSESMFTPTLWPT